MQDRTEVPLLRSDASFVCSALGSTVLRATGRGSQLDLLDGSQVLPNAAAVVTPARALCNPYTF